MGFVVIAWVMGLLLLFFEKKDKINFKVYSMKQRYSYVVAYIQIDNIELVQLDRPSVEHQLLVVVEVHSIVQHVELTQQLKIL